LELTVRFAKKTFLAKPASDGPRAEAMAARRLSLGTSRAFELEGSPNRRVFGKSERSRILALELEGDRFPQIAGKLIEGGRLGDDREVQTFADVEFFAFEDADLNDSSHAAIRFSASRRRYSRS
jgi:hypothetical protein